MKNLFFTILFFMFTISLYAQNDTTDELLKKLVEKQVLTQEEADEIQRKSVNKQSVTNTDKIENSALKARNIFNNTPYLQIGGYGLFLYRYDNTERIKHDAKVRVLFLNARGQLTNTLSYFFMAEFVNPKLYEYYADWTPLPEINFRLGQFKVPFTIENPISLSALETIQNSRTVSSLAGMKEDVMYYQNNQNNSGRDVGLQLSGSMFNLNGYNLVEYKAGIFQGSGMNTSDVDNSKNFAGTLSLQPIRGFRIAGGAIWGDATYKLPSEIEESKRVRNRWALSADYQSGRLYTRIEWIHGRDGGIDREGLYGLAKYYVLPAKFSIITKIDYYNQNKDINREVTDYLIGADYNFYKNCRIQFNYLYSDYTKKWGERNAHSVMGQLQFVF